MPKRDAVASVCQAHTVRQRRVCCLLIGRACEGNHQTSGQRAPSFWLSTYSRHAGTPGTGDEPEETQAALPGREADRPKARWAQTALGSRRPLVLPTRPNERRSLNFVRDAFTDGCRFRALAVVDDFTRECLALVADTSLSGLRLAGRLYAVISRRAKPMKMASDYVLYSE